MQYEKVSLAMAIRGKNAHYRLNSIHARHWRSLALAVGVDGLWDRMIEAVTRSSHTFYSLQNRLPPGFPESVFIAIGAGIERHSKAFLAGLEPNEA